MSEGSEGAKGVSKQGSEEVKGVSVSVNGAGKGKEREGRE